MRSFFVYKTIIIYVSVQLVNSGNQKKNSASFIDQPKKAVQASLQNNERKRQALEKHKYENIREEIIDDPKMKFTSGVRKKKFRVWKPLGTLSFNNSDRKIINLKTNRANCMKGKHGLFRVDTSGFSDAWQPCKGRTKTFVKAKDAPAGEIQMKSFRNKSFLNRCYLRAKLKLDSNKVSTDTTQHTTEKPVVRSTERKPVLQSTERKPVLQSTERKPVSNELLKKRLPNIKNLFTNELIKSTANNSLTSKKYPRKNLEDSPYSCLLILITASLMSIALCALTKWRHRKKYLNEIEFLFRRKFPFCSASEMSNESVNLNRDTPYRPMRDSSQDSYGSMSGDDVQSERTLLNLPRDKVDLSNITLCKHCQLYRFKSTPCCD